MLIRWMRAENFMKFERLELTEFPARGLIGIVGRNEGGKTTIGELIQFALFGKTLSVSRGSILDLIHWEGDHCVVELEFEHGGIHRVWREIDRYGTNYARLLRVDREDPGRTEEIAAGAMPVAKALEGLLHFCFDDFLRSFYLAERDFPRSPELMREFLDRMTGIEVLLSAREAAGEKIGELEERFGELQAQVRKNEQQIARYLPNVEKIPQLEAELLEQEEALSALKTELRDRQSSHERLEARISSRAGLGGRIEQLARTGSVRLREAVGELRRATSAAPADAGADPEGGERDRARVAETLERLDRLGEEVEELRRVAENAELSLGGRLDGDGSDSFRAREREESSRLERARGRRRLRNSAAVIAFLFGLAAATVGLLDAYQILGEGVRLLPAALGESRGPGYAITILGAVSWLAASALAGSAARCRGEILDSTGELSRIAMEREGAESMRTALVRFREGLPKEPIATVAAPLEGIRHDAVRERLSRFREKLVEAESSGEGDLVREAAAAEERLLGRARSAAKEARKQVQDVSERLKKQSSKRDRLQSEIREYQKQDGRRAELEEKTAQLRKDAAELREEMDVHHLAQELLGETADSIRHRAGPSLAKGIRRLLPYLTDGRYQDLQVTPDFSLRLFTGAKSDFLDTHELSGGTLEGLSFGFRLTFAQAFVGAVTRAPQFLFLDEPFRAMDRERVRRTLDALSRLSDELPQVLVVLPVLDESERSLFDAVIQTEVGVHTLVESVRGAGVRGTARPSVLPFPEAAVASSPTPPSARGEVAVPREMPLPARPRREERPTAPAREERRPAERPVAMERAAPPVRPERPPQAERRREEAALPTTEGSERSPRAREGRAPGPARPDRERGERVPRPEGSPRPARRAPREETEGIEPAELEGRFDPAEIEAGTDEEPSARRLRPRRESPDERVRGEGRVPSARPSPEPRAAPSAAAPPAAAPPAAPPPAAAPRPPATDSSSPVRDEPRPRRVEPEAPARPTPGRVRENPTEDPSQFLAGIFDAPPAPRPSREERAAARRESGPDERAGS